MWTGMIRSPQVTALEQTLQFAERRHAILAGNVANMSTPGYQTRDLSVNDFQTNLKEAFEASEQVEGMRANPTHSPSEMKSAEATAMQSLQKVRDTMTQVLYHDGSDDNIEQQVTEIAKNQSMHRMASALLRSQFSTLNMAISESVNV